MLPTRPRLAARSTSSSCTAPAPTTATRVSCGVTLMRISSLTGMALALRRRSAPRQPVEELAGLVQRQAHHARVAAAHVDDEARSAPLDGVGAGLVVALAGGDVLAYFFHSQLLELDLRHLQRA